MVFNSLVFLIFLAVVLLIYYRLSFQGQKWLLLAASYFFYGWWDYRFVALLLISSVFDFYCGLWIDREQAPRRRKFVLACSLILNLGFLGVFKYYNFFADSLQRLFGALGFNPDFPSLNVLLPVGISFYTFLSMSYTIDVYRRQVAATRSLFDYLLYVCFFPHLVAGPIVHASYLLPQFRTPRVIVPKQVANGIWLILLGYVKKVVIADRLGHITQWGFYGETLPFHDMNAWLVVYAFAFQIYGDFSGYSDIARGLSKLMGYELVVNFKAPYLVANPAAFWKNWHISLSEWLRDYLYIPLGGNRGTAAKTYRNLMATMLLGGLWHGAGIAYILWGFYQGLLLSVHRWWGALRPGEAKAAEPPKTPHWFWRAVGVVLFFHLVCIGWLFFFAGSLPKHTSQIHHVAQYLAAMFRPLSSVDPLCWPVLLLGSLALIFQWKCKQMDEFSEWPMAWQVAGVALVLLGIPCLGVFEGSQFIYFQF